MADSPGSNVELRDTEVTQNTTDFDSQRSEIPAASAALDLEGEQ